MTKTPEDFEVGYGKPPVETRFKAGKSGNPKGRPKGSKNMATWARELLDQKIEVIMGGEVKRFPQGKVVVMKQIARAMTNDRAVSNLVKLEATGMTFAPVPSGPAQSEIGDEHYTVMLNELIQRRVQEVGDARDPA